MIKARQFYPIGTVIFIFVFWEILTRVYQVPSYLLPKPTEAISALAENPAYYLLNGWITFYEALLGLLLGAFFAIITAVGIYYFPNSEQGVMSLAILVKTMPLIAIAPLLTIWFGFGALPKILITAIMSFFPILINLLVGIQRVPVEWIWLGRVLGASKTQMLRYVHSLSGLPYLFAGLRVAAPLAFVGAVVAEWAGASSGLGRIMWVSYANLDLPPMFAAVFSLSTLSALAYYFVVAMERRTLVWSETVDSA